MITLNAEQRSPEWYAARLGKPTASQFDNIVDAKGKPSRSRQKYLYQLAGERVSGVSTDGYVNSAMQRGIELEPEARGFFELITDKAVDCVGMCFPDHKMWGCSPDGLVGQDSGLEIKCPLSHNHVGYLIGGGLPVDYFVQVQGNLLVTERKSWWFLSYFPGIKPLLLEVGRDDKFCEVLEAELRRFCDDLDALVKRIGG